MDIHSLLSYSVHAMCHDVNSYLILPLSEFFVIHNGIITNYKDIKKFLVRLLTGLHYDNSLYTSPPSLPSTPCSSIHEFLTLPLLSTPPSLAFPTLLSCTPYTLLHSTLISYDSCFITSPTFLYFLPFKFFPIFCVSFYMFSLTTLDDVVFVFSFYFSAKLIIDHI